MSEDRSTPPDPFRMWREWFQENEKRWSDTMTEIMGDDRYAQGMGRSFQEMLHTHKMLTDAMAQYLGAMNLPSRSDILDLGDRLGALEDTIASLQAEIGKLRNAPVSATKPVTKPKRTKQPPPEA